MPELHRLLKRQWKLYFGQNEPSKELAPFAEAVNRAYCEFDEDRRLLERSLELSSSELLQANADMRVLFESFPDLLFRIGTDGSILDYRAGHGAEPMMPKERLTGRRIQDVFAGSARQEFDQAIRDARERRAIIPIDYSISMKGQNQYYEARFVPSHENQIIVVIRNVTEKRKLEMHLLQSQKLETVGTLAGGIAHDLNNQLTPLVGFISLLIRVLKPEDESYPLLREANQAAQRCADVVRRLLNFSRPSSEEKKSLDCRLVLEDLKKLFQKFLPATIKTEFSYDSRLLPVYGNETELQTVFMNLATNARDVMPNGGILSVQVQNVQLDREVTKKGFAPGAYVLFTVKDSGGGIPPEILSRIFEPFFTTKERGKGTGLGLSMAFNIIKDHKGWIDVTSEAGRGTAFEIYLPGAPLPDSVEIDDGPATPPRGDETILIADDEESIRMLGKSILERLGYRVLLTSDGQETIQVYQDRQREIDAVVLDMTMPKMTGRQTLKKLLEINSKAKVILSSGYTAEGSFAELMQQGAKDFIQKPYTMMVLAQALRKCLDKK